jgi:uncharacterized protein YndB with AHSA1/START domain
MDANVGASKQLELTRDFDATPDQVWRAWTDPQALRQWHAQSPIEVTVCQIDPRVGGRTFMCKHWISGENQGKDTYCGWTFREIEPVKRFDALGFFADAEGNEVPASQYGATVWPDEVEISVELEPHNGGTRMTYKETALPIPKQGEWLNQMLDKLAEYLATPG